jgi:hypothetical protein
MLVDNASGLTAGVSNHNLIQEEELDAMLEGKVRVADLYSQDLDLKEECYDRKTTKLNDLF